MKSLVLSLAATLAVAGATAARGATTPALEELSGLRVTETG